MTQEAGVPRDLWGRIQKMIDESVAKLARSAPLRNASITEGDLTVKGGALRVNYPDTLGGGTGVFFGNVNDVYTNTYAGTGLLIQAPDGTDIAMFRSDDDTGVPIVSIRDAAQNPVFTTDLSGVGTGRPYLQNPFVPYRFVDWNITTTSTTFETLFVGQGNRTHAGIYAWTRSSMAAAGTTGEIRVMVNGVQLDTPKPVGFAQSTQNHGPVASPGPSYEFLTVEVQGRVTSGTGTLRIAGGGWMGRPPV